MSRFRVSMAVVAALAGAGYGGRLQAAPVQTVFVIAMENHNWTVNGQGYDGSNLALFNNPAAPYINSLVTPGNPNAAQVSYAAHYYSAGAGVHPSEPNYVWAEAGSTLGNATDADPSLANGNLYTAPHLTAQMNAAGVSWKNYQEDLQYASDPQHSALGTSGSPNAYYGSGADSEDQGTYNYSVKHNPMAFFTDTSNQNVVPISQLSVDLTGGSIAKYNWITPNAYNDQHSGLANGYTYHGTHYTGDQAAVAIGDHFLSQIVPQIMASQAYQNNGAIVLWWDETEGDDSTAYTIPEIVISPLARGNAYESTVALSHSSDVKTMEEIFQLGCWLNNPIPPSATSATGGYNTVSDVNDLSDLFTTAAIPTSVPEPASLGGIVLAAGSTLARRRRRCGRMA